MTDEVAAARAAADEPPKCDVCGAVLILRGPHADVAAWMRRARLGSLTPEAAQIIVRRPRCFSPAGVGWEHFGEPSETVQQLVSLRQATRVGFLCSRALANHAVDVTRRAARAAEGEAG